MQRAHQRHVRECLAQAIFHKVLEMEVGGTWCTGETNTVNTLSANLCLALHIK